MDQTQKIAYLTNAIQSSGFLPVLKAIWGMSYLSMPDEAHEQWENTWMETISYFRDTYSHRLSTEETKQTIETLLNNKTI